MLDKLTDFIGQRPGLESGNYSDAASYRSEMRRITRYFAPCMFLIAKVYADNSIKAEDIAARALRTFSGRLEWDYAKNNWTYTTGQYFPTEYRAAAWALLASLAPAYSSHSKYKSL